LSAREGRAAAVGDWGRPRTAAGPAFRAL